MVFIPLEMSKDVKPVRLIPLDDDEMLTPKLVVRLENEETERFGPLMRLDSALDLAPIKDVRDYRLGMPSKEELELRSHQPGVEALLTSLDGNRECLEEVWENKSTERRPLPWGWFALAAVLLIIAVGWSLRAVQKGETKIRQSNDEVAKLLKADEDKDREATKLINRINEVLRSYFRCTSSDDLIRYVRHPDRVRPMITDYYKNRPVFTSHVLTVKNLMPLTLGSSGNFWAVSLTLENREKKKIVVEVMDSGEPKVDWETLVDYQPMPWADFVATRPEGKSLDFRVSIAPDSLYSHEFSDTAKWSCFILSAKNSEEFVFGYCPKGSELERILLKLVRRNDGKPVSLIVRLAIPNGLRSPRGVMIEKLLSACPIYVRSPDSGI